MPFEPIVPATRRAELNPAFSLRPLSLASDIEVIHPWYQMDYARFWNMQNMTPAATRDFYADAAASGHLHTYLGFYRQAPAFVVECYDPADHAVGAHYPVEPGDVGMHFFVGPCTQPIRHFTRDVLRVVMAFVFDHLKARRVVVEPDLRNAQVQRLNAMVGFVDQAVIELPGKTAQLAVCTAERFSHSLKG